MRTGTKIGVAVLIAVALAVLAVTVSTMGGHHSEDSGGVYVSPPAEGMTMLQVIRDQGKVKDGKIKHHHHRDSGGRLARASRDSEGTCYSHNRDEFGDSGTLQSIVRGTIIPHWCVGARHPNRIVKDWWNFDFQDNFWLGWSLNWSRIEKQSPVTWAASNWCGQGVCYPVQRKTEEYRWQWVRSVYIPILDKVLVQHATFYATCTVRGSAPGTPYNWECYSGIVN